MRTVRAASLAPAPAEFASPLPLSSIQQQRQLHNGELKRGKRPLYGVEEFEYLKLRARVAGLAAAKTVNAASKYDHIGTRTVCRMSIWRSVGRTMQQSCGGARRVEPPQKLSKVA